MAPLMSTAPSHDRILAPLGGAGPIGRRALLTGALALTAAAASSFVTAAPARAEETSSFPPEFVTAPEDLAGWDPAAPTDIQRENARLIIAVSKAHGIPPYGAMIALSTAIVESWLYNRATVTDGTSGGLFQQQTSQGWGTAEQVRDKIAATRAFFGVADHTPNPGLLSVRGWEGLAIGDAAQRVQRSAHPQRYEEHAAEAIALYDALAPGTGPLA
ncbi:hypothetical protein GCM10027268_21930 [Brachybacterium huguangmaarense]